MDDIFFDQQFFSAARRGLRTLSPADKDLLKVSIEEQILEDGSFPGPNNESDIYMSSFGFALQTIFDSDKNSAASTKYLKAQSHGENLAFLHIASLSRCWRFYSHESLSSGLHEKIAEKLEYNRCNDGAWNQASGTHFSSVYVTHLAIATYQDLDIEIPDEIKVIKTFPIV